LHITLLATFLAFITVGTCSTGQQPCAPPWRGGSRPQFAGSRPALAGSIALRRRKNWALLQPFGANSLAKAYYEAHTSTPKIAVFPLPSPFCFPSRACGSVYLLNLHREFACGTVRDFFFFLRLHNLACVLKWRELLKFLIFLRAAAAWCLGCSASSTWHISQTHFLHHHMKREASAKKQRNLTLTDAQHEVSGQWCALVAPPGTP